MVEFSLLETENGGEKRFYRSADIIAFSPMPEAADIPTSKDDLSKHREQEHDGKT
jgi:hypothetical protein